MTNLIQVHSFFRFLHQVRPGFLIRGITIIDDLHSGVARGGAGGGICPRAPPGGGRQNPAKDLKKIYIRRNF